MLTSVPGEGVDPLSETGRITLPIKVTTVTSRSGRVVRRHRGTELREGLGKASSTGVCARPTRSFHKGSSPTKVPEGARPIIWNGGVKLSANNGVSRVPGRTIYNLLDRPVWGSLLSEKEVFERCRRQGKQLSGRRAIQRKRPEITGRGATRIKRSHSFGSKKGTNG